MYLYRFTWKREGVPCAWDVVASDAKNAREHLAQEMRQRGHDYKTVLTTARIDYRRKASKLTRKIFGV